MDLNLTGKVALVTGGSRGLGAGLCRGLAAEGAHVAVNYVTRAHEAEELAAEINRAGVARAITVQGDVASNDDVERMVREAEQAFSRLDILVNNAGISPVGFVTDISEEDWRRTLDVNLTGTFLTSRALVRRWIATSHPGRIVNIVSQAAFNGSATGKAHYAASKAGVVAFTVSLAQEVAQYGILVNAVAPGMVLTEATAETLTVNAERYRQRILLGRVGEAEEVANVVTFLASDRARYMTGATVDVSGGMLLR